MPKDLLSSMLFKNIQYNKVQHGRKRTGTHEIFA